LLEEVVFTEKAFDAIIKTVLNRPSEAAMAIEGIRDLAFRHQEFASQIHEGHMRDKAWLQSVVERLAVENRAPLRALPEPVGNSVRTMQIGDGDNQTTIDEPTAEVLRAHEPLEIGGIMPSRIR
jgi:hypothetical protein